MTANQSCQEKEILAKELRDSGVTSDQVTSNRMLVVPEMVENQDESDGKTEWSQEDMDKFANDQI